MIIYNKPSIEIVKEIPDHIKRNYRRESIPKIWSGRHTLLGSSFHPNTMAVIQMATTNVYAMPSYRFFKLLDVFIRGLVTYDIWNRLDFLYIYWHDASTVDFARINIVRPTFTLSTGSPNFTASQGIGNNGAAMNLNFSTDLATGNWLHVTSGGDCHIMAYSKVGGTNTALQTLINAQDGSFIYTIRSRTNPRTDGGLAQGLAGPTIIQAGNTQSNTMYAMEKSAGGAPINLYVVINGVMTLSSGVASSGAFPSSTINVANSGGAGPLLAGRYVGAVSGGLSLGSTRWTDYNTLIQSFRANL